MKEKIMRKSAALLITLLVISSLGLFALTSLRASISSVIASARISHGIIADELSYAGVELYLANRINLINDSLVGNRYCNIEDHHSLSNCETDLPSLLLSDYYVFLNITRSGFDELFTEGQVTIYSTGVYGGVYKKHKFTIDIKDQTVQMIY